MKTKSRHPLFELYRDIFEEPWCPLFGQLGWPEKPLRKTDSLIAECIDVIIAARRLLLKNPTDEFQGDDELYGWDGDGSWPDPKEVNDHPAAELLSSARAAFIKAGQFIIDYRKEGFSPHSIYEILRGHQSEIDVDLKLKDYQVNALLAISSALTGLGETINTALGFNVDAWGRVARELLSDASQEKENEVQSQINNLKPDAELGQRRRQQLKGWGSKRPEEAIFKHKTWIEKAEILKKAHSKWTVSSIAKEVHKTFFKNNDPQNKALQNVYKVLLKHFNKKTM